MFKREKPKESVLKRAKPHKGEVKQQICNWEEIIKACEIENSKSETSAEKKKANERQIKLCTRAIAKLKETKNKKLT